MSIRFTESGSMDFSDVAESDKLPPVYAGEMLRNVFMIPPGTNLMTRELP